MLGLSLQSLTFALVLVSIVFIVAANIPLSNYYKILFYYS